jgi:site-specific recombinase XerC
MQNNNTATLRTPYRNALSAFDVFSSIRKAEGLSPVTLTTYRSIVIPFLKAYPSFLENPRECIIRFVSEPENPWSRFSRIKVLKVFCRFLVEEGILEENPTKGIKTVMPEKRAEVPEMENVREFISAL